MKVYKFCSYMLSCRREPYSEPVEQCDGFDEALHVLEGSGYRSRRRHGEGNKGNEDERLNNETSMKVRPLSEVRQHPKITVIIIILEIYCLLGRLVS